MIELDDNLVGGVNMLDIQQIQAAIRHRYPFLLVDRVLELEEGKKSSSN